MESDSETQDVALALGELRASPTRLQRLANKAVNNLGLSLVDVAVEPREAGQVAIVLPEAWAYLFLAHLEATAKQVQEQLRRAMYKAKLKDARLQEQLEVAAREWETRQVKIQERYRKLIAEGLSQREAIRHIKEESHGQFTATEIAGIVTAADPRKKRARQERDKQIGFELRDEDDVGNRGHHGADGRRRASRARRRGTAWAATTRHLGVRRRQSGRGRRGA